MDVLRSRAFGAEVSSSWRPSLRSEGGHLRERDRPAGRVAEPGYPTRAAVPRQARIRAGRRCRVRDGRSGLGSALDPRRAEGPTRVSLAVLQRRGAAPGAAPRSAGAPSPRVGAVGGALSSPTRSPSSGCAGVVPASRAVRARMEGAFGADFFDVRLTPAAEAGA